MSKKEILHTRLGEMMEMMDCHAIATGKAEPAAPPMSYDDVMALD